MAAEPLSLKTLDLIFQKIIASYAQRGIEHVDLSKQDFYLTIATQEMFDVYETPSKPVPVGSLVDDMAELQKFLGEHDHMATLVDIERLGNVLRAASELM